MTNIVQDGVVGLLLKEPLWGHLLMQMDKVKDSSISSLAVAFYPDRVDLHYNPQALEKYTPQEVQALLIHECMHVLLLHHLRRGDRDPELWNIATDIAINQHIPQLPSNLWFVANIPELEYNKTAEEYYETLRHLPLAQKQDRAFVDPTSSFTQDVNTPLATALVTRMVRTATAAAHGRVPNYCEENVATLLSGTKIPWGELLLRVSKAVRRTNKIHTWRRPNRRLDDEAPGIKRKKVPRLVACIDTSCSMQEAQLQHAFMQLEKLRAAYKGSMTLLESDGEVQAVYKLGTHMPAPRKVHGRGGTDFRPALDWARESGRTDLMVYFTDGDGIYPDYPPPFKVIWCIMEPYPGYQIKTPWGYEIRIPYGEL